ncbi:NAD(P)/FAD-dependent oxidoreductase [Paenibacillus eucommiae]|uniref:Thioredoxin reductase n=1 Tax=Paenibacillus eucommiae TaxID=1355755 RepID=A0ABS4J0S4_9BACL|nr:NAD(P)/FAD-dependent oxidoreductase [Paenibacillus eucommiae]MBP1993442.1 thioredoxin reductase [Paenibacillus eucommiae]
MQNWDCLIVGGGIAGLQAAIQLGRYEHRVLVVDAGYGRSTLCRMYHNLLGWPQGVSGEELRRLGRMHAKSLGVEFAQDEVIGASHKEESQGFQLQGKTGTAYSAKTLLLATGLLDRFPELPGLRPCLGLTVYVCPDCDGYELKGKTAIVLGSGDVGAAMALTLKDWTIQLTYVNHECKPVKRSLLAKLEAFGIGYMAEPAREVITEGDGKFRGLSMASGSVLQADRGFIAFGGNEVKSELARQLGIERLENRHILADPRSKQTNVPYVWTAGDVGVHAEQVTIAMGEGSQAAIWMHKALMSMQPEASQVNT